MIKLETHCHTFGTSSCADTDNNTLINKFVSAGYGGIVVTNHFSKNCYDGWFKGDSHAEKINYFFDVYENFSKECLEHNIRTFCGAEIRVKDARTPSGTEYTVVGLPREVFYNEKLLFELTQEELFELSEKYRAFMYQTHPFRTGVLNGNPEFMHGAESFNGHYHHANHNDLASAFCTENRLIGLSGTDFHHVDQPITAGIYLPEDIKTERQLADYYFEDKFKIIAEENEYLSAHEQYTKRK